MKADTGNRTISFIFDGDCPLCRYAATVSRIREEYGNLQIINARSEKDHPLIIEVNQRGLNLDEGMVITDGEQYFHGETALTFLATHGAPVNPFMLACKSLFRSSRLAALIYPGLKGMRNKLIRRRGIGRIHNLGMQQLPVFASIFGNQWQALPSVMHKHYANRPYCLDEVIVKGCLDTHCAGPIKWFGFLFKRLGLIPPFSETNVPVTVTFASDPHSRAFHFQRLFEFTHGDYRFHSRMLQVNDGQVIEIMRFGLYWKTRYSWEEDRVKLHHLGYGLKLFGWQLPLPLTYLLGKGYAEEWAVDDQHFEMMTTISHPIWGKIYEYKGRFQVIDIKLEQA